ncbi:MAG: hypothetical protein HOO91_16850 [Bacteroidales bacterium]|nr:hypothetical protein [Bacteroidales bacterium]
MAKLENIIGEILKSVTQAGHNTNEFVKDLAMIYKDDPLLKAFPMPRAELKTVEVNLKFAFNPTNYSRKCLSGDTIQNAIKIILDKIEALTKIKSFNDLSEELDLLIKENINNFERVDGIQVIADKIASSVKDFLKGTREIKELDKDELPKSLKIAIKKALININDEIYSLRNTANASEMDVELSSEKLQNMVTSEIKFVTAIEKHYWKKKEDKDNPLDTGSSVRSNGPLTASSHDNDFFV